jgi:hypothetical protein
MLRVRGARFTLTGSMRALCLSSLILAGCAGGEAMPGCSDERVKELKTKAFKAETAYEAFAGMLECGELAKAYLLLSLPARESIKEEEFILAMTNFDEMRRMLIEAEVHKLDAGDAAGAARVCNPEFRMTETFEMRKEFGKLWTFNLDSDQIKRLTDGVLGWYDRRTDDGVRHVFPAGYPHPDARRRCPCGGAE